MSGGLRRAKKRQLGEAEIRNLTLQEENVNDAVVNDDNEQEIDLR